MHKIKEYSLGSVKISDATLSKNLARMSYRGEIELAGSYETYSNLQRRMHYSLGHHGRRALRFELDRLEHTLALAKSAGLLDSPPPTPVDMLLEDMGLPRANV